jgi:hypothetical protein
MPNKIEAAKQELKKELTYVSAGHCLEPLKEIASVDALNEAAFRMMTPSVVRVAQRHGIDLENWCAGKALTDVARQAAERAVSILLEGIAA